MYNQISQSVGQKTQWLSLPVYSGPPCMAQPGLYQTCLRLRAGSGPSWGGLLKNEKKKNSCLDLVEECEVCRFWAISAAANLSFLPDEIL